MNYVIRNFINAVQWLDPRNPPSGVTHRVERPRGDEINQGRIMTPNGPKDVVLGDYIIDIRADSQNGFTCEALPKALFEAFYTDMPDPLEIPQHLDSVDPAAEAQPTPAKKSRRAKKAEEQPVAAEAEPVDSSQFGIE